MEKLVIFTCKPCTPEKQKQVIMTKFKTQVMSKNIVFKTLITRVLYYFI